MRRFVLSVLTGLLLQAALRAGPPPSALELSEAETGLVRRLAEDALKAKGLFTGKVYLTRIELILDTNDKEHPRNALVIHYRYAGDTALLTSVNLGRKQVTKIAAAAHFPTSLAAEELAQAEKLAWANAEVRKTLARYGDPAKIEVDALMIFTADASQPWHHHRVVRLFFRKDRDYLLYAPFVDVDLTTETVRVERMDKMHEK